MYLEQLEQNLEVRYGAMEKSAKVPSALRPFVKDLLRDPGKIIPEFRSPSGRWGYSSNLVWRNFQGKDAAKFKAWGEKRGKDNADFVNLVINAGKERKKYTSAALEDSPLSLQSQKLHEMVNQNMNKPLRPDRPFGRPFDTIGRYEPRRPGETWMEFRHRSSPYRFAGWAPTPKPKKPVSLWDKLVSRFKSK